MIHYNIVVRGKVNSIRFSFYQCSAIAKMFWNLGSKDTTTTKMKTIEIAD